MWHHLHIVECYVEIQKIQFVVLKSSKMTSEKIFKCFLKGLAKNTGSHRISLDKTNVANLLIYCKQKKKISRNGTKKLPGK